MGAEVLVLEGGGRNGEAEREGKFLNFMYNMILLLLIHVKECVCVMGINMVKEKVSGTVHRDPVCVN